MNITREKLGELDLQIKIEVAESDYAERVEKQLKRYRQQATLPGFRKGTAPMGLISKMYRSSVMSDEVQNVMSEALYNYIETEKLDLVGGPISNVEKTGEVDFEKDKDFVFWFDCALFPTVELKLDEVKVPLYQVKVTPKEAEKQVEQLCDRYGKFETPEAVEEGCMMYGKIVELDKNGEEKEGGLSQFVNFNFNQLKNDEEIRAIFLGMKAEEKVRFAINKAFTPSEIQAVFRMEEAESKKFKSEVEFCLSGVSKIVPHEQNEELFSKVLPGQDIKDAAAFKKAITKEMEKANNEQCQVIYVNKVREALIESFTTEMPEEFMKKFILNRTDDKELTMDKLNEQWEEKYRPGLKWEFIEKALEEKNSSLVPKMEDVVSYIKGVLSSTPEQGEQTPEEREKVIDEQARTIAQDQSNYRQIEEKLYNENLFAFLQAECKPEVEKVTIKELSEKLK